jgi:cobalamin biosynthesis protein CbiG
MNFNLDTKTGKAFNALVIEGQSLTSSEAKKRFGIGNLSEASRIRQAGYAIYANTRKAKNGVVVTEYRHGKPSRAIVAAGYKAMALGLV